MSLQIYDMTAAVEARGDDRMLTGLRDLLRYTGEITLVLLLVAALLMSRDVGLTCSQTAAAQAEAVTIDRPNVRSAGDHLLSDALSW
jgi:hypothetical protein